MHRYVHHQFVELQFQVLRVLAFKKRHANLFGQDSRARVVFVGLCMENWYVQLVFDVQDSFSAPSVFITFN